MTQHKDLICSIRVFCFLFYVFLRHPASTSGTIRAGLLAVSPMTRAHIAITESSVSQNNPQIVELKWHVSSNIFLIQFLFITINFQDVFFFLDLYASSLEMSWKLSFFSLSSTIHVFFFWHRIIWILSMNSKYNMFCNEWLVVKRPLRFNG